MLGGLVEAGLRIMPVRRKVAPSSRRATVRKRTALLRKNNPSAAGFDQVQLYGTRARGTPVEVHRAQLTMSRGGGNHAGGAHTLKHTSSCVQLFILLCSSPCDCG